MENFPTLTITIARNVAKIWASRKKYTASIGRMKTTKKLMLTNIPAPNVGKFFIQKKDYD